MKQPDITYELTKEDENITENITNIDISTKQISIPDEQSVAKRRNNHS